MCEKCIAETEGVKINIDGRLRNIDGPEWFRFQDKNIGREREVVLWAGIKESLRDIGRSQMS